MKCSETNPVHGESRLAALEAVYRLYDRFVEGLNLFCRRGCAHCCTANVTLTSLEARYLLDAVPRSVRSNLLQRLAAQAARRSPAAPLTTNKLARLCAEGRTPPEVPEVADAGRCPLLTRETCPVYTARPFACRCLVSTSDCDVSGCASMDEFTLSLNTVFLQCIEHLDASGVSGSLAVLPAWLGRFPGRVPPPDTSLPSGLAANSPLTVLMVPPEQRAAMAPWLERLRQAMTPGHPAGGDKTKNRIAAKDEIYGKQPAR